MMSYSGLDFVYYELGVNIIPADTINKKPLIEWEYYQTNELTESEYLENKKNGLYNKGIAIICGKIWRGRFKDYWINGIDLDNELAIKEFCTRDGIVSDKFLSENLVESHEDDPHSIHVLVVTDEPMLSKAPDKNNFDRSMQPAIEVKSGGDKLLFSYPSMHGSDDKKVIKQWMFNELKEPNYVNKAEMENHIDNICVKHHIDYLKKKNKNFKELIKEKNKIPEGARHDTLLTECNALWWDNIAAYRAKKVTDDEIFQKFLKIAERCDPPHDATDLERIFLDSAEHVSDEIELDPARLKKAEKEFLKEEKQAGSNEKKNKQEAREKAEYERIKKLSETIESFEEWQKGIETRFQVLYTTIKRYIPDAWLSIEFSLSVKHMMFIHGITKPFAGIVLGVPSSSKTVGLELLRHTRHVYYTDKYNARSWVSHYTGTDEELANVDMLPKVKNKCFLTPELAPLFSGKDEDLNDAFGTLTRVLDGSGFESDSGVHGHRGYNDRMMFTMIGAAVEIPYKVHKLLTTLGPRLYFLRIPKTKRLITDDYVEVLERNDFEDGIKAVQKVLLDYEDWFEACPIAIEDSFFKSKLGKITWSNDEEKITIQKQVTSVIVNLSILLAHLRGVAAVYETKGSMATGYAYGMNVIENPIRAMRQLVDLAKGHAVTMGRNYITMEDLPLIMNVALSTAPKERVALFNTLLETNGRLTAKDMTTLTGMHHSTASRTMTELKAIELVDLEYENVENYDRPVKVIYLKEEFKWFLSPEFDSYRKKQC